MVSNVDDCKIIKIGKSHTEKGNLTVVENNRTIPFEVKRIYYLYDVPAGESRGGHAHKDLYQYIIAASGSFEVVLDDGIQKKKVFLNKPYEALYIVPGIWRELENFSSGSVCMVLASSEYSEADYIREFSDFLVYKGLVK